MTNIEEMHCRQTDPDSAPALVEDYSEGQNWVEPSAREFAAQHSAAQRAASISFYDQLQPQIQSSLPIFICTASGGACDLVEL